jgi:macrolide-specific efflux system membrane fusion protein
VKKIVIAAVILAAAGTGFFIWKKNTAGKKRGDMMTSITVKQGPIERTVDATGTVTPQNRVEIKPPISGRVEELLVDEGSHVKSGQILAWMSSSDRAAILDAARAKGPEELKKWKDSYKATPIVAPLSGVIILRNVVVGQTVDASTVLYAMSDHLIVKADIDEADIGQVKLGLPTRITLDAYPDQPIDGKVSQILYEGKNVSNVITYGVKIQANEVPTFFRSGMTANVALILDRRDDAILVPASAVKNSTEGSYVLVPGPENKPVHKTVETGLANAESVQITSGLNVGDQVVVMRARYTPQKAQLSSPLTMGGGRPAGQSGGSGGGGRSRQ